MKFKNNKDFGLFICMNIFGAPITYIGAYVFLGWHGLVGCLIFFLIFYKLWKWYGKYNYRLTINPGFTFGSKIWHIFNRTQPPTFSK